MAMARGLKEIYHDHQMVVALADLRLVGQSLTDLKIEFRIVEQEPALGLALLELDKDNMTQAVQGLFDVPDPQITPGLITYRDRLGGTPEGVPDLDLLLEAMRRSYDDKYPNWAGPRIGKNHGIDNLSGAPEIGPGGVGDPIPSQTELPPRPPEKTSPKVKVAQIDGAMYENAWLAGAYIAPRGDLIEMGTAVQANQGHAVAVASCILSVAPDAELHLERVLGSTGAGTAWNLARKMVRIAGDGYDVVNVSVGQCFSDDRKPPLALDAAVRLLSARSVVIAAAGNHGNVQPGMCPDIPGLTPDSVYYPAGCYGAVAVGALDQNGEVADFTPKEAPYIRLLAPGKGVTAAYVHGEVTMEHYCLHSTRKAAFKGWATVEGTSFATGIVTGEIARRAAEQKISAQEALGQLLTAEAPVLVPNPRGGFIRPC